MILPFQRFFCSNPTKTANRSQLMIRLKLFVFFLYADFLLLHVHSQSGGICHRSDKETTYVSSEMVMSRIGSKAILYCCIINSEFIGWVFMDARIESNQKYSLSFERSIGAQVLTISNIQESDSGTYFCRVNAQNKDTRDFPVLVNIKAQLMTPQAKFYLEISKTEKINIGIVGIPFPTIHFYRGNNELLVENYQSRQAVRVGRYQIVSEGDIIIHELTQADTGQYLVRLNQGLNYASEDFVIEIYAGARPFVAYIPFKFYNFTLGQNEVIPARFSGSLLNIYWKFTSDITGETTTRIMGDNDAHYFVSVDGSLRINNVVTTDTGRYVGVCQNPWGEVQVSTFVPKTIRAAQITLLNNEVVAVGAEAIFRVKFSGSPVPAVSWWRNGVQIPGLRKSETEAVLIITNVRRNDAGIYTCIVDNGASEKGVRTYASKNVTLFVEGFPVMDLINSTRVVIVTENRKIVQLRCVVRGVPASQIKFIFKNQTFLPSQNVIGQQDQDVVIASLKLTIENANQTGNYSCIATNAYGTSSLTIMVKYMDIPSAPNDINIIQVDPNVVKIGWENTEVDLIRETYIYLATIWDQMHFNTISILVSDTFVTFTGLKRGQEYYFSVRSSNAAGWSSPSRTIMFQTPNVGRPSPPQILNRDIFLISNRIRLYWAAPMDTGGNDIVTYTVKKCLWDVERITFDKDCETFTDIRSNELYFLGLIAFEYYDFYVSAQNSVASSDEARFQVFSGPQQIIGSSGTTEPTAMAATILIMTLLIVILVDLLLCIFLQTGIICWLFKLCFLGIRGKGEENIPLRRDSLMATKTQQETIILEQTIPGWKEEIKIVDNEPRLLVEDHNYSQIANETSKVAKNKPEGKLLIVDDEKAPTETILYSYEEKKTRPTDEIVTLFYDNQQKIVSDAKNSDIPKETILVTTDVGASKRKTFTGNDAKVRSSAAFGGTALSQDNVRRSNQDSGFAVTGNAKESRKINYTLSEPGLKADGTRFITPLISGGASRNTQTVPGETIVIETQPKNPVQGASYKYKERKVREPEETITITRFEEDKTNQEGNESQGKNLRI